MQIVPGAKYGRVMLTMVTGPEFSVVCTMLVPTGVCIGGHITTMRLSPALRGAHGATPPHGSAHTSTPPHIAVEAI